MDSIYVRQRSKRLAGDSVVKLRLDYKTAYYDKHTVVLKVRSTREAITRLNFEMKQRKSQPLKALLFTEKQWEKWWNYESKVPDLLTAEAYWYIAEEEPK